MRSLQLPHAHMAFVLVSHGPNAHLFSQVRGDCPSLLPKKDLPEAFDMLQVQPRAA